MNENQPSTTEIARKPRPRHEPGLSAKLLLFTILFVMVSEIFVFVPSVSNFRRQWLMERLEAAKIASFAADAALGGQLPKALANELLESAKVKAIAVKRADQRELMVEMDMPAQIDAHYDLREASWLSLITDASVYVAPDDRAIRVIGEFGLKKGEFVEVVMGEGPLKTAMIRYGLDILGLSILISIITAALVYLSLDWLLVKPMTKLTWNIVQFSERPEDPTRVIARRDGGDEIGTAERASSPPCRPSLRHAAQKSRLAALGLAVSKISHDLRNVLSSAAAALRWLARHGRERSPRAGPGAGTSRFARPRHQALRAHPLDYGQAQETPPNRQVSRSVLSSARSATVWGCLR